MATLEKPANDRPAFTVLVAEKRPKRDGKPVGKFKSASFTVYDAAGLGEVFAQAQAAFLPGPEAVEQALRKLPPEDFRKVIENVGGTVSAND